MRNLVKSLIGIAAAVVCISGALILEPTLASAQDIGGFIGGAMRAYGGYGYRGGGRSRHHASSHRSSKEKDAKDEDEDSDKDSKNSAKDSDKRSAKNSSDKDKDASADNKSRRELSNAKDNAASPAPTAKVEPPKTTADDEPSFSPSR
jgi:hypothetical protein